MSQIVHRGLDIILHMMIEVCMKEKFSFVIPCYGSEKTITKVIEEVIETMEIRYEYDYEIICVNDASPDGVLQVLRKIAQDNTKVKIIDFAINSGQQAAIMAGLSNVRGDYIVSIDDDFQCPTNHLWELFKPIQEGYDISYANYGYKKESFFRNFGSWLNDFMCCVLLNKPKNLQLTNFVVFKRFIADKMLEYNNPYPYIDGLILRTSSKIANVSMEDRERLEGSSTYTLKKLLHLFINGFTAFSVKPLRLATFLGLGSSACGFIYMLYIIIARLTRSDIDAGYSSLMAVNLFVGGVIMSLLGVCGEYIGRIYISINNSPQYVIREKTNFEVEK